MKIDRLTALLNRFRLIVQPTTLEGANLAAFRNVETGQDHLVFQPREIGISGHEGALLFALHVDFDNLTNPLQTALPEMVVEIAEPDSDLSSLVSLLASEQQNARCGAPAVLGRLGEVLVVRMLRLQLERGATNSGLLAGLAHPRISPVIVAIHDNPEKAWSNAALAGVAGLSQSRFKELFASAVGTTPGSYLRRWRMVLARMDLQKGDRVERVAHRYGYTAPDAFSRAFMKEFGVRPSNVTNGLSHPV